MGDILPEYDLLTLINNALLYFDKQNNKYSKLINITDTTIDRSKNIIIFDKVEYKYEILGVFDNTTNIWMWAWMIPEFIANETTTVKKLLNYGLKISPITVSDKIPDDKMYLKTQLLNSRFMLNDYFQLELHLAIASYLVKDNMKFIYYKKRYLDRDKTNYITVYYLIS